MIKNYLELNDNEKQALLEFLNRNNIDELSPERLMPEEMDRKFIREEFDFGRGVLARVQDDKIVAAASVVLKECKIKGVSYITKPELKESLADKPAILEEIIDKARKLAEEYGAMKIFLGTRDNELIKILRDMDVENQYCAIKMTLKDRNIKYPLLKLVPIDQENKKQYLDIYNDGFRNVPNGSTLTEAEVEEHLANADENNSWYIAETNDKRIGFLQFNIKAGSGEFDLGLIARERGKGYGKLLLETAIGFLNDRGVKEISLTVITKNERAYNMYIKRGFSEIELLSRWYQL